MPPPGAAAAPAERIGATVVGAPRSVQGRAALPALLDRASARRLGLRRREVTLVLGREVVARTADAAAAAFAVPGVTGDDPRALDPAARAELAAQREQLNLAVAELEQLSAALGREVGAAQVDLLPPLEGSPPARQSAAAVVDRLAAARDSIEALVPRLHESVTYLDEVLVALGDVPHDPFGDFDVPLGVSTVGDLLRAVLDVLSALPPILEPSG